MFGVDIGDFPLSEKKNNNFNYSYQIKVVQTKLLKVKMFTNGFF